MSAPRKRAPVKRVGTFLPRRSLTVGGPVHMVLDLETVTDPEMKDCEKKKDGSARFPPPPAHQIVCAGWAVLEGYCVQAWGAIWEESEEVIVQKLVEMISTFGGVLVTFNGRGFDVPVLAGRALRYGVSFPWLYRGKAPRYRYDASAHLDLMDYLADYSGFGRNASLDVWARLCGWPGKGEISGSDVALMVAAGQLEEVADYCLADVCQETALLLRTDLLRGEMNMATYLHASMALVDFAEADQRTAALALGVDRARFLLDPLMNDRAAAE